jgi:hypothetical protein
LGVLLAHPLPPDLHDQAFPGLKKLLNRGNAPAGFKPLGFENPFMELMSCKEKGFFLPDLDEGRAHTRQNCLHLALVNVPHQRPTIGKLKMDLHELPVLDNGHPLLWPLGRRLHRDENVITFNRADLLARRA